MWLDRILSSEKVYIVENVQIDLKNSGILP